MKNFKIYLIGGIVLLALYLTALYNQPKAVDWDETFDKTEKAPFGTLILYDRLHDIFPKAQIESRRQPISDVMNDDSVSKSTYLIICNSLRLSSEDYKSLCKYIKKGNDVLIATENFGRTLNDELDIDTQSEAKDNSQTYLNFISKSPGDSTFLIDHKCSSTYFSDFDTLKTKVLGQNGYNHPTFIKVAMGKGNLLLSANPKMFTNYSLLQDPGMAYAARALSYLKVQDGLVYDEFYSKGRENEDSTMRVFLSHTPLKWAFYIVVFSLLLFALYQSKRRQRIIPVIPPVANTTVEFANIVGQVYYEQRNNGDIARKRSIYFLEHIRSKYNLQTRLYNPELMKALADKSGADIHLITAIFNQITLIENGIQISDAELLALNQHIEQFYDQSR